jgi:3,4-dihydroxy 2-butanone 4-phosphate synthase/GTP cyclohydrolase II
MVTNGLEIKEAAFTVSVDAKKGITTGISAHDRAVTIRALVNPKTKPLDLARPGHIFPLIAQDGGVLVRAGHTEATVDLARLAQLAPAAVICEIIREDGAMARLPDLQKLAAERGLAIATIADLIEYRRRTERLIERVGETTLPTDSGEFRCVAYRSMVDDSSYLALVKGEVTGGEPILVRVDSGCLTGHVFGSLRCDCRWQLQQSLQMIEQEGRGVLLYVAGQEGRGIGICNKIRAYELQESGYDTVEANVLLGFKPDERDYGIGAQVLWDLGVRRMRLLTNNPKKYTALTGYGLEVVERVPLVVEPSETNRRYLTTKAQKMGHLLDWAEQEPEAADTTSAVE